MCEKIFPVLFIGHGSPMNITADNDFTRDLQKLRLELPRPDAILVISAHWLTRGTFVTGSDNPGQIYDFYGFPDELYRVKYRPAGSAQTAKLISDEYGIGIDGSRGIDHAGWAILKHIYPAADIPVLELSINITDPAEFHFLTGKKIRDLRYKNILVIGSGNIVHNLYEIDFDDNAAPYRWAARFDGEVKDCLFHRDFEKLIHYDRFGENAERAIPTNDHYLPLITVLGMAGKDEKIEYIHESIQNGSISMRSFIIR